MRIEIWRDEAGYRVVMEDPEFDLTTPAFASLVEMLDQARAMDDGEYRVVTLDLSEEEE